MAVATALDKAPPRPPAHSSRPNMVSIGTIVWLSSELMFFSALFAIYFTLRSASRTEWPPVHDPLHPVHLHIAFSAVFTIVLVASSFTCQFGVWAAEKGNVYALRRWFLLTFFMGAFFVGGQSWEYFHENEFSISSHAYGSAYYLTTGFHGLHVIGGLVAFIFVLARSLYGKFTPEKATSAIVVSYYWHFVDVVWIGLYATIYLIR